MTEPLHYHGSDPCYTAHGVATDVPISTVKRWLQEQYDQGRSDAIAKVAYEMGIKEGMGEKIDAASMLEILNRVKDAD